MASEKREDSDDILNQIQQDQREFWKGMRELKESIRELRESQGETKTFTENVAKAAAENHQAMREARKSIEEANGNFNNKWGHFLENLLEGDLVKLLNEQNIKVEEVFPRLVVKKSSVVVGEYDLVAVNGNEVVVVEVKTTLEKDDVGNFLEKLSAFKSRVSAYKDKTLYGAIAYMSLKQPQEDKSKEFTQYKSAFHMAQEKGLFLIQSPGGARDVSQVVNGEGFKPTKF